MNDKKKINNNNTSSEDLKEQYNGKGSIFKLMIVPVNFSQLDWLCSKFSMGFLVWWFCSPVKVSQSSIMLFKLVTHWFGFMHPTIVTLAHGSVCVVFCLCMKHIRQPQHLANNLSFAFMPIYCLPFARPIDVQKHTAVVVCSKILHIGTSYFPEFFSGKTTQKLSVMIFID